MGWEMRKKTEQTARKDYPCQACEQVLHVLGMDEKEFTPKEWELMMSAKEDGFKIKKRKKYIKITGKYEGEFATFRARPEIDEICHSYDLYGL